MMQSIPCMLMRGGTSRGPIFLRDDLPKMRSDMESLLLKTMGSPHSLQVDGVGGGHPLTSKVAIVGASEVPGVDVDYTFAQVAVERRAVDWKPNCGNMLAAVGPFALERGLLPMRQKETTVKVRNINTGALVDVTVMTPGGVVTYEGDAAIDGVDGRAAPIYLHFRKTVGGVTGSLLPAGGVTTVIDGVETTLVDAAVPVMMLRASDVKLDGSELPADIDANPDLFARVEALRVQAGEKMGLGDVTGSVLPKVALLSPSRSGGSIQVRYLVPDRCHRSVAVTGAVAIAISLSLPGSVPEQISGRVTPENSFVTIEHPSGRVQLDVVFSADCKTQDPNVEGVKLLRTARKIFDGNIYAIL